MRALSIERWLLTMSVALALATALPAQFDRRDRQEPALMLNTGGRTAYCDALMFTDDGKYLLAAGDDKVVSIWKHGNAGLSTTIDQTLRWPSWREQRGAIYAMALSPDDGGKRVAIGGYGMRSSTVAILDRNTGDVLHSTFAEESNRNFFMVTAVAFSADGKQLAFGTGDGSIWTWDMQQKPVNVGRHKPVPGLELNWVRLIRFIGTRLVSIAEDGELVEWDTTKKSDGNVLLNVGMGRTVRAAAMSADGLWLAAAMRGPAILLRSLDGKKADITLPERHFPMCVAFNSDGKRLAVGINSLTPDSQFYVENGGSVHVFDVQANEAKLDKQLPHVWRAEAVAFHGADRLAVAGGDNHAVTLWNLAQTDKPLSVSQGSGKCIWSIRLTDDGTHLIWQDQRDNRARHPNRRGGGNWKVFALEDRAFLPGIPNKSKIVDPLDSAQGWHIEPDEKDSYLWYAVNAQGTKHALTLDRERDGRPNCYTFLPQAEGDGVRVAVGHYWGWSLFTFTNAGATRTHLMTGHSGEVYSLSPSADGSWLVSAGNDQTIAAWNLKDWPSQAGLGAAVDGNLSIKNVDIGSPAWEAGLIAGDRVELLAVGGKLLFDVSKNVGTKDAAVAVLRRPEAGKELFFQIRRPGVTEPIRTLTTVRQRPLWRFFAAADQRDWVLNMWHGSYYDTSENGDYLVGWHMNDITVEKKPQFFRAEQLRRQFQNEAAIDQLLKTRDVAAALRTALGNNPTPVNLGAIEPPATQIRLSSTIASRPVTAEISIAPRGDNVDFQPKRVELWINDFRFKTWHDLAPGPFSMKVTISPAQLRSGDNRITLQAFNRLGGRSDAVAHLNNPATAAPQTLVGLAVGIDDYKASGVATASGQRDELTTLESAVRDARQQQDAWQKQAGKLYAESNMLLRVDQKATRTEILSALDEIGKKAKPDDRLVLFLAGHGDFLNDGKELKSKSRFVFCGPNYSREKPDETGIDHNTLYERLADIPCRKLVIIDACRSGEAVFSPTRLLVPAGQGPTILAACGRDQRSYEHKQYGHGLFTYAVLQAFGPGFSEADTTGPDNKPDGKLDARELFEYVSKQMPGLLRSINAPEYKQVPQRFPPELDRMPIISK
jgi:WD40 repeat protein/uncharacterized caspase-like protein